MMTWDGLKLSINITTEVCIFICLIDYLNMNSYKNKILKISGRNNIQKAGVQYILDSVVDELIKDPVRRSLNHSLYNFKF